MVRRPNTSYRTGRFLRENSCAYNNRYDFTVNWCIIRKWLAVISNLSTFDLSPSFISFRYVFVTGVIKLRIMFSWNNKNKKLLFINISQLMTLVGYIFAMGLGSSWYVGHGFFCLLGTWSHHTLKLQSGNGYHNTGCHLSLFPNLLRQAPVT